jgi:hypothetical protein
MDSGSSPRWQWIVTALLATCSSVTSGRCNRGNGMAYFPRKMDNIERGSKCLSEEFLNHMNHL